MLASATSYPAQAGELTAEFVRLGFPAWVRPLLAVAKVVGVALLGLSPSAPLRHFAYAGFLINFVLATLAHGYAGDGEWMGPSVALAPNLPTTPGSTAPSGASTASAACRWPRVWPSVTMATGRPARSAWRTKR